MVIFGQSETQEGQSQYRDPAIQNQEPGFDVQVDLGGSLIERLQAPVPAHVGKSIKLTQGFKVTLIGPSTGPYNGREAGYHKHGFTIEQKEWLESNVGITVGHHLWEEGEGQWLYQGSRWGKGYSYMRGGRLFMDFRFRDRRKAMLFKLIF